MAKPTKLTPALLELLCDELRKGKPRRAAAAAVGIGKSTFYDWQQHHKHAAAKLRDGGTLTANERLAYDAGEAIELAVDEGESWLIDQIIELAQRGKSGWQAFATVLERTRPDVWQRKRTVDHGGQVQVNHTFDPSKLTDSELDLLERMLRKAAPSED